MRRITSRSLRVAILALIAAAMGPAGIALADPPTVTIANPLGGSALSNNAPTFAGTTNDVLDEVTLAIYAGSAAEGEPVQTLTIHPLFEETWSRSSEPLADGTYTAEATQTNLLLEAGASAPVTFTVDTVAPSVTLSGIASPTSDPLPSFGGDAGVAPGDLGSVKLKIYSGSLAVGPPVQTLEVTPNGPIWQASPQPLADGTYTAQAEQSDEAGNTSASAARTFTIDTTPPGITLTSSTENGWSDTHAPVVEGAAGTAEGDLPTITIKLFAGASIGAQAPLEALQVQAAGGSWSAAFGGLADGLYTVRAEQSDETGNTARSESVSFTVDTIAPAVSLASVPSLTTDPTPSFNGSAGVAAGDLASIRLKIYAGAGVSGELVQTLEVTQTGSEWSAGPVASLEDGIYTAQAEQSDEAGNLSRSSARTFTVKQEGPKVTLTALAPTVETVTPTFSGSAGVAPGDIPSVELKIYAGTGTSAGPVRTLQAQSTGNVWSIGPVAALAEGTYTAQAEQSDEAGNVRVSQPSTFTIALPPPITTTTTTTSTATSTTTSTTTKTTTTTTTTTATAAPSTTTTAVASTTTTEAPPTTTSTATTLSIPTTTGSSTAISGTVTSFPYRALMQPFPIVRIAGADTPRGARLRLLTVQAPAQARITVWCRGRGCPHKPESRIAAAGKAGVVVVEFKQFERPLFAGAVLVIRVSAPGEIGKYTRFHVRRGKLPERLDTCLDPAGMKPVACPS